MNKNINKAIKIITIDSVICIESFFFNTIPLATAKTDISENYIFKLINEERTKNDIIPLTLNNKLTQAAINKAKYLAENNSFDHSSNNGDSFSSWIKDTGYEYSFIGENLAKDFSNEKSIIKAWLQSSGHKENILNSNFTETGIAAYNNIVVQIFGRPQSLPLSIKKTIGDHLSENLILYTNENSKLINYSHQNSLV